ncbi:dna polymerase subunit delta-4 [Moniliophthora roreri MCA 2997]|uniref:Dna polymerase subunit delta-4 n=2 Tax=Moniliophthora roreri TaxID=221103 RepID=V2X542_MONRO|nr:dna polymerase subunit delta-4 [Moniliophthora roreri MCA 2997]KAI3597826.1 dna polymerase subunit delta-4 [Moniliophthora roreri]
MPPTRSKNSSEMKQTRLSFTSMKRTDSGPKGKLGTPTRSPETIAVKDSSSSDSEVEQEVRKKRKNRKSSAGKKEKGLEDVKPTVLDQDPPRLELKIKDPRWNAISTAARAKMNNLPPIHAEGKNRVHHTLNVFDMTYEYGPCMGLTRLERWERANAMGLNPPVEIREILLTRQGIEDTDYAQCSLYGQI